MKTEETKTRRNEVSAKQLISAQGAVPIGVETAREAGGSDPSNLDCWAAIDTANMKSLDGSLRQMLDTALTMAEVGDDGSSNDGSH